jgi:hypothetical protein
VHNSQINVLLPPTLHGNGRAAHLCAQHVQRFRDAGDERVSLPDDACAAGDERGPQVTPKGAVAPCTRLAIAQLRDAPSQSKMKNSTLLSSESTSLDFSLLAARTKPNEASEVVCRRGYVHCNLCVCSSCACQCVLADTP